MPRSGRYRGRRRLARLLAGIGITLVISSVLAVTAFLFLRDYVSMTDDGFLLSLPFLNRQGRPITPEPDITPEPETDDINLIVEPTPTPSPAPTPEPELPVAKVTVTPVFLAQADIGRTSRLDEIAELCGAGGADTVVIEVKSIEGTFASVADLERAAERLAGHAKLVAYFSVLEDNSITRQRELFGIKHTTGVNWLDANKSRWINPYVDEAREWLAAQLSMVDPEIFAAVILDNLFFPIEGRLEVMALDSEIPREEIIETLKSELVSSTLLPCWTVDVLTRDIKYEGDALAEFPAGAFG
ncbi:MAG: hypothetical protein FWG36_03905 [Oscillospiraceae bacterium]|nr:hypothetical protein [Oscillospiraceae bacterium]